LASVVGVIPAAGYATRLGSLSGSKEILPVGGRPVMDYLVERMRAGGCTRLRVVTRPAKVDLISHAEELGAEVVLGHPETVSASFLAGMEGLATDDVVLIGFPDTVWEPVDGFQPLRAAVDQGCEVAAGLFRIDAESLIRSDVVAFGEDDRIARIDVKPTEPASEWIWGCAAARAGVWAGLERTSWPGEYLDLLCREGRDVRGVKLSDVWIDIGTPEALRRATSRF
jgi:NDP-sugar pyrophosphorylase family protein